MATANYNVIGVMSGTSLDGIDLVLVNFSYDKKWLYTIEVAQTVPYNDKWKEILSELTTKSLGQLQDIDNQYSTYLGAVVNNFITQNAISSYDFVSSHGHTALHQPKEHFTYQIGNLQEFANVLNSKVICDFRVADVRLGGQGAPLVPIGDELLFNKFDFCLNLGGFANVSYNESGKRIAFDICPVNIVLNRYVSKLGFDYDDKGQISKKGKLNESLLQSLNSLSFYAEKAPKSLGLEWVNNSIIPLVENYKLPIQDILRTFVEHVAIQISKILSINQSKVLITGGGTFNDFLLSRISNLSKSQMVMPDDKLIEFKEALIFAFLGVLKDRNEINCFSSVTGASTDHSTGRILLPKNTV